MIEKLNNLESRLKVLETRFYDLGTDMNEVVQTEFKRRFKVNIQATTLPGIVSALCVSTNDPWKQGRIRFYCPLIHTSDTPIKSLPWAHPIAPGAFDDSGMVWVPPAGSTVALLFENGDRDAAYYIGGIWHRNRKSNPSGTNTNEDLYNFGYNVEEFYKVSAGHRKGYLVGKNDESQVFPPWNTENYNGYDLDSIKDFENNPEAQKLLTYSNHYGFKTPEKHMIKMVDGNAKCGRKWKRFEQMSGCGIWMCMKDDHLHPGGQWANPICANEGDDATNCEGDSDSCQTSNSEDLNKGGNKYFKNANECRPYRGVGTPENTKCDLPQSGWQVLSLSGHTLVMDDSVEQPTGQPTWEKSLEPFKFGCTNLFTGKTYWKSATGHMILMDDKEDTAELRGETNGIQLLTAHGQKVELNDHTVGSPSQPIGGKNRGIKLTTTSNNKIHLIDEENEQGAEPRRKGGSPINKAKKAYIQVRTGYGLEIMLRDANNQEETEEQYIQITSPQKSNLDRGAHILRMQEKKNGPGQVFLRAGGEYIISTYDSMVTQVGSEQNPSNKILQVSNYQVIDTKQGYYNHADAHIFFAEKYIVMAADRACASSGAGCGPCIYPVIVAKCPQVCPLTGFVHWTEKSISDRVFAASTPSPCGMPCS